jgi:ElaB/YqjD/DUF883 family membrane-anchored ribosome-binding protein
MDQEPNLSAQRPEEIRDQIAGTRSDLTEKVEALEQRVRDTLTDATSAVQDTVETVKQSMDDTVQAVKATVHDTVDSVKHAFDLRGQVDRHPWAMLAGSLAAGFVLGRLLAPRHRVKWTVVRSLAEALPTQPEAGRRLPDFQPNGSVSPPTPPPVPESGTPERSLLGELTEKFAPEIQQLKRLAIGSLMALARDTITQSVAPPLGPELERVLDRLTTKLGGVPLSGPGPELFGDKAFTTNGAGK